VLTGISPLDLARCDARMLATIVDAMPKKDD
jgi:hypothetical protein